MKKLNTILSLILIVSVMTLTFGVIPQTVFAATLLNKFDTMSSAKDNTASNHEIVFRTPTGVDASSDTITIEFDVAGTAFNLGSVAFGDMDLDVSAGSQSSCTGVSFSTSKTLAASAASSVWGVGVNTTSDVITLTAPTNASSGEIAANACVRLRIGTNASGGTNQITNPDISSATSYTLAIAGAFGDSGDIVVNIIPDDQVSVSATVDESLTFTISDNSIGFGTLSASDDYFATGDTNGSATEVEAHTLVVGTNASNGYTVTVNGATLTSGANTITAIGSSNTASSPGTEQFGLRATASGGSGAVSAPYAASGFAFDTAAFPDEVAAATGASANTTYSMRYVANITSSTEAGAYTATLTYVATANF